MVSIKIGQILDESDVYQYSYPVGSKRSLIKFGCFKITKVSNHIAQVQYEKGVENKHVAINNGLICDEKGRLLKK